MENAWKNIRESIDYSEGGVISKVLDKDISSDVTIFCMAEGTEMSEHTSTKEGIIYVVEGDGIFTLEGEDIIMKPETMIFMKDNAKHSLKANKNTTFLLILREV